MDVDLPDKIVVRIHLWTALPGIGDRIQSAKYLHCPNNGVRLVSWDSGRRRR